MNRKLLFVLPLSWIAVGCMAQVAGNPPQPMVCKTQAVGPCKGDPQAPTVNVNTKSGQLKARPGCVNAATKTLLIFRLTPAGNKAKSTVEIVPKDPDDPKDDWLAGKNDEYQDLIMIDVPEDLDEDDYYYGIKTDTECVDPRVDVTK